MHDDDNDDDNYDDDDTILTSVYTFDVMVRNSITERCGS